MENEYYKTCILQWKAGEYYSFFSKDELMELFGLEEKDINKELYEECLQEYLEIYGNDL